MYSSLGGHLAEEINEEAEDEPEAEPANPETENDKVVEQADR